MIRNTRHTRRPDFKRYDPQVTDRRVNTLSLFNHYRNLPLNWMYEFADPGTNFCSYRNTCTNLYNLYFLNRRTINGTGNNNETQTYTREPAGEKWLLDKGYPVCTDYNPAGDQEQLLIDLALAQIELGSRKTNIKLHHWMDIKNHPETPPLPPHPFRYKCGVHPQTGKDIILIPDGHPFYLKGPQGSIRFIYEVVRTNKDQPTIKKKLRLYKQIENDIKRRFGINALMVLWITMNDANAKNILRSIGEEFDGDCKWHLVNTMTDYVKNPVTTIPITTHLFDTPYQRAGHPPFSLKTLSELRPVYCAQ